ncbi:hypothetical protein P9112_009654 [Eukaryota sp. TZLM1-RC]
MSLISALKNPIDDYKRRRIVDVSNNTLSTFVPIFQKHFKNNLIDSILSPNSTETTSAQLLSKPQSDDFIKTGYLYKQGGNRKNWKRRYFVVKPNYEIEYWEDEESLDDDAALPKGSIHCQGMRVIEDPQIDNREFCFELRHPTRRCWYFQAENQEEKDLWQRIFRLACRRAQPPLSNDPLLRKTFINAYKETRQTLSIYDSSIFHITCSEPEQLGILINSRLEREVMSEVYAALPYGGSRKSGAAARKSVQKSVDLIVSNEVNRVWRDLIGQVESSRSLIGEGLSRVANEFTQTQVLLKTKLHVAIGEQVEPILSSSVAPVVSKVFGILETFMTDAFIELLKAFDHVVNDLSELDQSRIPSVLTEVYDSIKWPWSNRLLYSRRKLEGCRERLEVLSEILRDVSPYLLLASLGDQLVSLMNDAVFTLENELKDGKEVLSAGKSVRTKLANDCKTLLFKKSREILYNLVSCPLKLQAFAAVISLVEPLSSIIPEPLKDYVTVERSLEHLLDDYVWEIINNVVEKSRDRIFDFIV